MTLRYRTALLSVVASQFAFGGITVAEQDDVSKALDSRATQWCE